MSSDLERSWNANIRPQRHPTGSPEVYAAILAARRLPRRPEMMARELRWAHDLDDAMSREADDLDRRPVLPVRQQVRREDELEC